MTSGKEAERRLEHNALQWFIYSCLIQENIGKSNFSTQVNILIYSLLPFKVNGRKISFTRYCVWFFGLDSSSTAQQWASSRCLRGLRMPHYTHSACLAIDFCLWTWIEDTLELAGGITSWHRHLRRSMHYGNLLNKKSSSAIISIRGSLNSLSQMARESKEGNIFKSWKDWPSPFVLLCQKSFICPFIPNQYNCFCSKPGPGLAVEAK